jgi:hypothetical protein
LHGLMNVGAVLFCIFAAAQSIVPLPAPRPSDLVPPPIEPSPTPISGSHSADPRRQ